MLVKAAQFAQLDHGVCGKSQNILEGLVHVDKSNMTQELTIHWISFRVEK